MRFTGPALAAASNNRNMAKTLLTGAMVATAGAAPVARPTGSIYFSVPATCPAYSHIVFHECSLAFAHEVADAAHPTAAVCIDPPEQSPGPFTDYFQMDTYRFIYDYPHPMLSTQAHPTCGPAAAASRPHWGRNILEGSLFEVACEVNFYRHISPLAKVEQGGTAVEALLGPPTHRDNAANHGGYLKTWHWFNTGDSWDVAPTDVIPLASRRRVPIPNWASPQTRTAIRSRAEPQMARAYAPMIRRGIDNAPPPTKIVMPSEAYLADQAALLHNYGLFSASYAPVITGSVLRDGSRGRAILLVPLHNNMERPAVMVPARRHDGIFGALHDPSRSMDLQAKQLAAFLNVGLEPQYATTSRQPPYDHVFIVPWDRAPLVCLQSAPELQDALASSCPTAWCTPAAAINHPAHAALTLALLRVQQQLGPMSTQPLIVGSWDGPRPVVAARSARSYQTAPASPEAEAQWQAFLEADAQRGRRLRECIAATAASTNIGYMEPDVRTCADYALELVVPQQGLPQFTDARLNSFPVPQRPPPLCTAWLRRLPPQSVPQGWSDFDYSELCRGWFRRSSAQHFTSCCAWDAHCFAHGEPPPHAKPTRHTIGPGGAKEIPFADGVGALNAFAVIWERHAERRYKPVDFSKSIDVRMALRTIAHHIGSISDHEILAFAFEGVRYKLLGPRQCRMTRNLASYDTRARGVAKSFTALVASEYMTCVRISRVNHTFDADAGPSPWVCLPGYQLPVGGAPKAGKPDETRCLGNMSDPPADDHKERNLPSDPIKGPEHGDPVVSINDMGGPKGGVKPGYAGPPVTFPDKEVKNTPKHKCAAVAYLLFCCTLIPNASLVCFDDDIRHMFFQFQLAESEKWMGIFYLVFNFDGELWYCAITMNRMNMGWRPASQIASRFAEEWLDAWRTVMDRYVVSTWLPKQPQQYRAAHRQRCLELGAAQARPFVAFVYTDNFNWTFIGDELAVVGIACWKLMCGTARIVLQDGPQTIGTCSSWIGPRTLVTAGLAGLTPDKEAKLHHSIDRACRQLSEYEEYQSTASFLVWACDLLDIDPVLLNGIHAPLKGKAVGDTISPWQDVCDKLRQISTIVANRPLVTCWVGVRDAESDWNALLPARKQAITLSSDACGDPYPVPENPNPRPHVCGIGPGLFWRYRLDEHWRDAHITLTESLGPIGNMLILMPLFPRYDCVLGVDATAAAAAPLIRSTKSDAIRKAMHVASRSGLLDEPNLRAWLDHWKGIGNGLSDLGSRDQLQAMHRLAAAFGMKLTEVAVPPHVLKVFDDIRRSTRATTTGSTEAGSSNLNMRPSPIAHWLLRLGIFAVTRRATPLASLAALPFTAALPLPGPLTHREPVAGGLEGVHTSLFIVVIILTSLAVVAARIRRRAIDRREAPSPPTSPPEDEGNSSDDDEEPVEECTDTSRLEREWYQYIHRYLGDVDFATRASRIMAVHLIEPHQFHSNIPDNRHEYVLSIWRNYLMAPAHLTTAARLLALKEELHYDVFRAAGRRTSVWEATGLVFALDEPQPERNVRQRVRSDPLFIDPNGTSSGAGSSSDPQAAAFIGPLQPHIGGPEEEAEEDEQEGEQEEEQEQEDQVNAPPAEPAMRRLIITVSDQTLEGDFTVTLWYREDSEPLGWQLYTRVAERHGLPFLIVRNSSLIRNSHHLMSVHYLTNYSTVRLVTPGFWAQPTWSVGCVINTLAGRTFSISLQHQGLSWSIFIQTIADRLHPNEHGAGGPTAFRAMHLGRKLQNNAETMNIVRDFNGNMSPTVHIVPVAVPQLPAPFLAEPPPPPVPHELDTAEREQSNELAPQLAAAHRAQVLNALHIWAHNLLEAYNNYVTAHTPATTEWSTSVSARRIRAALEGAARRLHRLNQEVAAGDFTDANTWPGTAWDAFFDATNAQLASYQQTLDDETAEDVANGGFVPDPPPSPPDATPRTLGERRRPAARRSGWRSCLAILINLLHDTNALVPAPRTGLDRSRACAMYDGPPTFASLPPSPEPMRVAASPLRRSPPRAAQTFSPLLAARAVFAPATQRRPVFAAIEDVASAPTSPAPCTGVKFAPVPADVHLFVVPEVQARPGSPQPATAEAARRDSAVATATALRLDSSPYSLRTANLDDVVQQVHNAHLAGIPPGTKTADETGFKNVRIACSALGDGIRWMRPRFVTSAEDKVRETWWTLIVIMHIAQHKAPSSRRAARGYLQGQPSSALNDIHAHRRVMIDCGRFVCDLLLVAKLIKGLNAMYVSVWGDDALVVQHAKPIPRDLLLAMRRTIAQALVPAWTMSMHLLWAALHCYELSTGERKNGIGAAFVGDTYLRRCDLVWVDDNYEPLPMTPDVIASRKDGDILRGTSPPAKCDRFKIEWGGRHQWFKLDTADPLNFATAFRDYEIRCPCPPHERPSWAAFGVNGGKQALTTAAIGTQFHALLAATPGLAKSRARTFHDYRATIASALANARAAGRADITNGLIQALVHWKTEESALRYSHLNPRDYAEYVQLGTATDAGFAANKDVPETDPFGTCAELDDIATKITSKRKTSSAGASSSDALTVHEAPVYVVQDDKTVTSLGLDTWGLVGRDFDVLNATWQPGQLGRSPCHVAAFIGPFAHNGVKAPSYVITDTEGDNYAVAANTLKSSLNRTIVKSLRGVPKPIANAKATRPS